MAARHRAELSVLSAGWSSQQLKTAASESWISAKAKYNYDGWSNIISLGLVKNREAAYRFMYLTAKESYDSLVARF